MRPVYVKLKNFILFFRYTHTFYKRTKINSWMCQKIAKKMKLIWKGISFFLPDIYFTSASSKTKATVNERRFLLKDVMGKMDSLFKRINALLPAYSLIILIYGNKKNSGKIMSHGNWRYFLCKKVIIDELYNNVLIKIFNWCYRVIYVQQYKYTLSLNM